MIGIRAGFHTNMEPKISVFLIVQIESSGYVNEIYCGDIEK
jgi:hypothetical protein